MKSFQSYLSQASDIHQSSLCPDKVEVLWATNYEPNPEQSDEIGDHMMATYDPAITDPINFDVVSFDTTHQVARIQAVSRENKEGLLIPAFYSFQATRGFTPQLFTAQIQSMQFAFSYPRPSIPIFSERQELADSQNYNEFLLPYYCSVPLATTIGSIDFLLCLLPKTNGIEGTNRGLIVQWVFDPGSAMESPYGLRKFAKNEQLTGYRTTYFANTQSKSVWQIYIASFAYLLHVVDMRTMGNILGISMPLSPTISYLTWTVNGVSRLLLYDKDYKFESSDVKFVPLICNAIQKNRQRVERIVAAQKFKMRIPRDCRYMDNQCLPRVLLHVEIGFEAFYMITTCIWDTNIETHSKNFAAMDFCSFYHFGIKLLNRQWVVELDPVYIFDPGIYDFPWLPISIRAAGTVMFIASIFHDALMGLKVFVNNENCMKLTLHTHLNNMDPAKMNHDLLISILAGARKLQNVRWLILVEQYGLTLILFGHLVAHRLYSSALRFFQLLDLITIGSYHILHVCLDYTHSAYVIVPLFAMYHHNCWPNTLASMPFFSGLASVLCSVCVIIVSCLKWGPKIFDDMTVLDGKFWTELIIAYARGGTMIARHYYTKGSIFMVASEYCPRASMLFSCHGLWELIANISLMNIFGGLVWTSTTFVLAMNIEHVFNKKDVHNSLCVLEYLFHLSLVEFYHSDIGLIFLLVIYLLDDLLRSMKIRLQPILVLNSYDWQSRCKFSLVQNARLLVFALVWGLIGSVMVLNVQQKVNETLSMPIELSNCTCPLFDLEDKVNLYGESNVMILPNISGTQRGHVAYDHPTSIVPLHDAVSNNRMESQQYESTAIYAEGG